jgi:hypothetical protein
MSNVGFSVSVDAPDSGKHNMQQHGCLQQCSSQQIYLHSSSHVQQQTAMTAEACMWWWRMLLRALRAKVNDCSNPQIAGNQPPAYTAANSTLLLSNYPYVAWIVKWCFSSYTTRCSFAWFIHWHSILNWAAMIVMQSLSLQPLMHVGQTHPTLWVPTLQSQCTPGILGLSIPTPGKSPRTSGRAVAVITPNTASSAASADGDAAYEYSLTPTSEGHKSFAGANSISLKKILDMFYDKVVAHEQIGHYFVGIDLIKLKRHQVCYIVTLCCYITLWWPAIQRRHEREKLVALQLLSMSQQQWQSALVAAGADSLLIDMLLLLCAQQHCANVCMLCAAALHGACVWRQGAGERGRPQPQPAQDPLPPHTRQGAQPGEWAAAATVRIAGV